MFGNKDGMELEVLFEDNAVMPRWILGVLEMVKTLNKRRRMR